MPSHSSHLLQPLNVGYFSPLKRAYGDEIMALARVLTTKIDKPAFIKAYRTAYYKTFTESNICSSFRGAGLVPFNPEVVLSKLDIKLRTPTPPVLETTLWESRTPSNTRELDAQTTLLSERMRKHRNSSPTEMLMLINSLTKGATLMVHNATLIHDELSALRKVTEAANNKKTRKRKFVQNQGTLIMGEGSQLAPAEVVGEVENSE
jgi:hypothetical protein